VGIREPTALRESLAESRAALAKDRQQHRTTEKGPSARSRRAFLEGVLERSIFRCRLGTRRSRRVLSFRTAEPAHGICSHAPEDRELRGLGLLGLAILALVFRADELSVHEDVIALVERVGDGLAEAVEGHDAVPLGFFLNLARRSHWSRSNH
jgi:hypothetical protein